MPEKKNINLKNRAMSITFSMRPDTFKKLLSLEYATGKNRSELLTEWVQKEEERRHPQPAEPISTKEFLDRQ
jgi:hypothetical protein